MTTSMREFSFLTQQDLGSRGLIEVCRLAGIPWRREGYGLLHCMDDRWPSFHGHKDQGARVTMVLEDVDYVRMIANAGPTEELEDDDGIQHEAVIFPEALHDMTVPQEKARYVLLGWPDDWRELREQGHDVLLADLAPDS